MRIVCPSASSLSVLGGHAGSSAASTSVPQKRRRSKRLREHSHRKAEDAKKKVVKKTKVHAAKSVQKTASGIDFVYVGNLRPGVKNHTLQHAFGVFGPIRRTIIRCSRGQVVGATSVPQAAQNTQDLYYATVEFVDPRSAKKALALNGAILQGLKIVVSFAPNDLPEVQLFRQTQPESTGTKSSRAPVAPQRPLPQEKTERLIDYREPSADRNRVFGFSFAKCII